jgi:hypothetical protein
MSEQQPLLQSDNDVEGGDVPKEERTDWREWTAEKLEAKSFHTAVISLARPLFTSSCLII